MAFRLLQQDDREAFFDLLADPSIAVMAASVPLELSMDWIKARIARGLEHGLFDAQGNLVAAGSNFRRPETPDRLEVGYSVHRDHRGQGHAQDLLARLIARARADGALALHAGVAKDNPGSLHILEKAGFRIIGEEIYSSLGRGTEVAGHRLMLDLT